MLGGTLVETGGAIEVGMLGETLIETGGAIEVGTLDGTSVDIVGGVIVVGNAEIGVLHFGRAVISDGGGRIESDGWIVGIDDGVILGAALTDGAAVSSISGATGGVLIAGVDDRFSETGGTDKVLAVDLGVGVTAIGLAVFVLEARATEVVGLTPSVTLAEVTKAMGGELVAEGSVVEELLTD